MRITNCSTTVLVVADMRRHVERAIEGDPVIRRIFNRELSTLGRSPDTFYVNPLVQRLRPGERFR